MSSIYNKTKRYINANKEELSLLERVNNSLSRCYKCHSLLNDGYVQENYNDAPCFVIRKGLVLQGICSKCLEDVITKNDHTQICEGCGERFHQLFNHHWYDPQDYSQIYFKKLCQFCNVRLQTRNLWKPHKLEEWQNHILPNWELQLLYLNNDPNYETMRELYCPWDNMPHIPLELSQFNMSHTRY